MAAHTRRAIVIVKSAKWARSAPLAYVHDLTAEQRHGDAPAHLPAGIWRIAAAAHHACGVEFPIFLRIEYADVGGCSRAYRADLEAEQPCRLVREACNEIV